MEETDYMYNTYIPTDSDRSGILFAARIMHLRFLERKRKNTAGVEQQRQKDTSGKSGHVKPVHPCTGLTTRFANSKTCFCLEPPPSMAVVKTLLEL